MSDLLRMTGMYSGMDTESVIQQLVKAKSVKVTNLKNDQKKLEWKQSIWQDLNSRIYKLWSNTLSNMRLTGSYSKKKSNISDPTKATITAGDGAVNGMQTLEVKQTAKSGYLTGAVVSKKSYDVTKDTKLSQLGVTAAGSLNVNIGGNTYTYGAVDPDMSIDQFVQDFNTNINTKLTSGESITMSFNNGKISLECVDSIGQELSYGLSTTGSNSPTVVGALGLSNCTPSDNVSGSFTGTKIHIPGSDYQDETNVTLEDLDVLGGTLTIKGNGQTVVMNVDKSMTVDKFIAEFNKQNNLAGTGVSMSVANGKVSIKGPSDGSEYTVASDNSGLKGYTVLQGLGLGKFGGDAQTGDITGNMVTMLNPLSVSKDFDLESTLSAIDPALAGQTLTVTVGKGADAKTKDISLTGDMKISELVNQLKEAGIGASFDVTNQRFFVYSTGTGLKNEFSLTATGGALQSLGLDPDAEYANGSASTRIKAQDAEIVLNGATFTSDTNTFSINGLSITANAVTDDPITITTDTDYDGIYNMIKDFIEEYNDIMNEMTKLYSADSARKYSMLSDEEKEAMTDEEVEKWETTIKDSLLRRDNNLNSVMECMKNAINKGYEIGGETLFLVNFGVGTGSYFETEKAERNALHIFGDSDDDKYADKDNDLKTAIAEDPDKVIELFAAMSKNMYDSLHETMGSTNYRSIYKVYDDKRMKTEYDDYTKRIKEAEKKLNDFEDKWYKKFSAMEVALSKLQSNQNSLASMLGQ
ncbi:MAG: flagellar filament capping protein FliD [Lachnospiraceae bacterium]|nr:flagellar filament capping protein FliD [Lachnospiraceae bacterium]